MPRRSGPLRDGERVVVRVMGGVRRCRVGIFRVTFGATPRFRPRAGGRYLDVKAEGREWARGWKSQGANALRALVAME